MGKLRHLSGPEVLTLLTRQGFVQVRQRGSHVVMQKRLGNTTVTVVVPNHPRIPVGTLMSIVRQSRLDRKLFESP